MEGNYQSNHKTNTTAPKSSLSLQEGFFREGSLNWHKNCYPSNMSPFQQFLKQLAIILKFTTLSSDKHGACLIVMKNSNTPILFEFDDHLVPNTILMSTPIIEVDELHAHDFYTTALSGNHQMEETLSLKPDEKLIYLHRRISPLIEAESLKMILDSFLQVAVQKKQEYEVLIQKAPKDQSEPPSTSKGFRYKV